MKLISELSVNVDAPKLGTLFMVESVDDDFGHQTVVLKEVEVVEQGVQADKPLTWRDKAPSPTETKKNNGGLTGTAYRKRKPFDAWR